MYLGVWFVKFGKTTFENSIKKCKNGKTKKKKTFSEKIDFGHLKCPKSKKNEMNYFFTCFAFAFYYNV